MKKITLFLASALAFAISASAQAPKYALFEHFTQASCGPCASQNPGFESTILNANPTKVRHIAYHTSWPGTDPMNALNAQPVKDRVTYYSITGVPSVKLMGNVKSGAPGAFTQADVDNIWSQGSPIKIEVTDTKSGTTHNVTVKITSVGTPPSGSYNLLTAVVEDPVDYTSPPGSNGEKHFPNVFRLFCQTNSNGEAVTLPTQGNNLTKNYSYNENAQWKNVNNIKVIAFLQNTSTKEVIQCGSSKDPVINGVLGSPSVIVKNGTSAQTFNLSCGNTGSASEQFTFTLTSTHPSGWASSFTVNGNNYTTTGNETLNAGASNIPVTITSTPSATIGIGKYVLSMTSVSNPTAPALTQTVYVISGVTDLIVNGTGGLGDNSGTPSKFEAQFTAGLQSANNTAYAITDAGVFARTVKDAAIGNIKNIYMNMAWSFPTLTDDLCNQLTSFLGQPNKCMFICGQDIGWETNDATGGYSTTTNKNFFTTYMGTWANDGGSSGTALNNNTGDMIFGTIGNHTLTNATYTSSNYFPDELSAPAANGGAAIFYFGTATTKLAGTRRLFGTQNKVVYLTAGIEQFANATSKNQILKLSHDWFYGLVSTQDFDNSMLVLGQNYPNPANGVTNIPVSKLDKDVVFEIVDVTGRVVYSQVVSKGTELISVDTKNFENGMYLYRLMDGNSTIKSLPMQVAH